MNAANWFSIVVATAIAMAPVAAQIVSFIPAPYGLAASAGLAAIGQIYHLFQPSPSGTVLTSVK